MSQHAVGLLGLATVLWFCTRTESGAASRAGTPMSSHPRRHPRSLGVLLGDCSPSLVSRVSAQGDQDSSRELWCQHGTLAYWPQQDSCAGWGRACEGRRVSTYSGGWRPPSHHQRSSQASIWLSNGLCFKRERNHKPLFLFFCSSETHLM